MSDHHYDVIVVGGGMVGGLLACALGDSALRVAVLEAGELLNFHPNDAYALRVSALSLASQRMLEVLGVWPGVVARRACPYRRMLVWEEGAQAQTMFDSHAIATPQLGHIVENHVLQLSLKERLQQFDNIEFKENTKITSLRLRAASVEVHLSTGKSLQARLLVGADGANSSVRQLAGIAAQRVAYQDQHALVASVETALAQQDITWQRFNRAGPEAMLPLCGPRASLVWYHTPERIAELRQLPEKDFIVALQQCFPQRLGRIEHVAARGSFPLARMLVEAYVRPRLALVGDAAHSIHPLAGLGVNLGLLDAASLAEVVLAQHHRGGDIGALRALRRYQRWRSGHNRLMAMAVDGFYRGFKPQPAWLEKGRQLLLDTAQQVTPINHLCMRFASGLAGDLPRLARGVSLLER